VIFWVQVINSNNRSDSRLSHLIALTALVIAGETIFLLPFVLSRIFRPTFLDIFNITNLQLGTAFSLYGIIAMVSYFAGGPLADRFPARHLLVAALLATSLGGLIMASIPPISLLTLLYGFWGLTTIFLFWGALIKTTRELGGHNQGQAFGLLDGGRGLFAAVMSSLSVLIFASLLPEAVETASFEQRSDALGNIILLFSGMGVLSAVLVWFFIPLSNPANQNGSDSSSQFNLQDLKKVLSMKAVWCQALIILCAYVAYKSTDDFSLYARDAFGYNEVDAARIGTISFWMRPIAAVSAGLLADRFNSTLILIVSFSLVIAGSTFIAAGLVLPGLLWLLLLTIAATSAGIYALRGLYFAIFGEAAVPAHVTGTAVGVVSFVGFTPDIFMGPLMGYLLDNSPGAAGHQHVFMVVALFAVFGLIATVVFKRITTIIN
jgi:MFS family permease